jgi:IS4 transposase
MQAWIAMESKNADFGDQRLDARYRLLLQQLSDKPSQSIPTACGGQAETAAAYRFFDNDKTDPQKVLTPHRHATLERVRAEAVVIAAQDTTEIDLTRRKEKVGGPLSDLNHWGLYAHPLLTMTPQRVPLGVVDVQMWSRDPKEFEKTAAQRREERRGKAFEEKESHRWRQGYQAACALAAEAPNTKVVWVSDSEGDIYECLVAGASVGPGCAEWIVRGCQDRAVVEENRLLPLLGSRAALGQLTIQVSKREATTGNGRKRTLPREARQSTVTVRSTRTLLRPPDRPGKKLPAVALNVVLVREENPPQGEEPIEWLLLTSLPVETFAQACVVIDYYCCRWEIEVYFRVLKSGCKIEDLQFQDEGRFQVCLAFYLIVAWRVLYVLKLGRECPEMSSAAVFTEAEWKSVYVIARRSAPPKQPPTLGVLIPMIASLGGYLDRKHDGPPGPQTMWIGLQRMRDFALAWSAFGPVASMSCV